MGSNPVVSVKMIKTNINYLIFLNLINFTYLLKYYNIILFKFINNNFFFIKNKVINNINLNFTKIYSFNVFKLNHLTNKTNNNFFLIFKNNNQIDLIKNKIKYKFFIKNKNNSFIIKNFKQNNFNYKKYIYFSFFKNTNSTYINDLDSNKYFKKLNKSINVKKYLNYKSINLNFCNIKYKFLFNYFTKKKLNNTSFTKFKKLNNIKLILKLTYNRFLLKTSFFWLKNKSSICIDLENYNKTEIDLFDEDRDEVNSFLEYGNFKFNSFMGLFNANFNNIKNYYKINLFVNFINILSYKMFFNIIIFYPFLFINYLKNINNFLNIFNFKLKNLKNKKYDDNLYFQSQFMEIGSFLEFLTNKNVNVNILYNNFYDINNLFKLILNIWLYRIKHFYRTFNNSYDVALIIKLFYLSVKNKDIHLLMKIITDVTPLVEFKKQRRFFKFIIFMFRTYYSLIYNLYNIQGFQFEFRGKISVEGNPRTRKMYAKILRPSPSNYTYSTKYIYKTVNTHTGVMGIKIWLYYKI